MDIREGVQAVVNDIYRENGEVRASMLVDAARPVDSPAHAGFQWDDSLAAEEYRLNQARGWLRRVQIIVDDKKERLVHVPVVAPQQEEKEGVYIRLSDAAADRNAYKLALGALVSRIRSLEESVRELERAAVTERQKEAANRVSRTFIEFQHEATSIAA